jgi:transcriptional regulator with XRE-family HTH domain
MLHDGAADERISVGARLREFREMRGYKPDELANVLGISRAYLANIEAGRKPLTRLLLPKFARALDVRQISIVPPGFFTDAEVAADEHVPPAYAPRPHSGPHADASRSDDDAEPVSA